MERPAGSESGVPPEVVELLGLERLRLSAQERREVLGALERLIRRNGLGWVQENSRLLRVRYKALLGGRR
jgi:hypothetical protein